MNFQFIQNTGDRNDFQLSNLFAKAEPHGQTTSDTDFSFELDRISSFQELYNSINKMTLKPDWNFVKNDNEVVIYKVKSVSVKIPKLSVIIKITAELDIDVWVEEVALDVKSTLWKLLGYNFVEEKIILRYSMILDLIRFLDVNQLLVTDRRQKWQLNSDKVTKVLKGPERYCSICFKILLENQAMEIDADMLHFLNDITQIDILSDKSLSLLICQTCTADIEEIKRFRLYLQQAFYLLETTFKSDMNIDEIQNSEGQQLILIRAQYNTNDDLVGQPPAIEDVKSLKTETTFDEEWLLEDEEENHTKTTIEIYEELTEVINDAIDQEVDTFEETTSTTSIFNEIDSNASKAVNLMMPSSRQSRKSPIIKTTAQTPNSQGLYECPKCDKTYPTRAATSKHLYRVHSPATEKCPVCHKIFNPYKLQCHMHFHKLQHKCEICNKR